MARIVPHVFYRGPNGVTYSRYSSYIPAGANGSRGRYYHAMLQRRAAAKP